MAEDMLFHERILWAQGCKLVAGIDEAGRGPLAGPVVAACVILDPQNIPEGVDDSKKLSEKKREELFDVIMQKALSVSVGIVDHTEIDRINILNATLEAMNTALDNAELEPDFVIVDGNKTPRQADNIRAIVKGDAKSATIACASIIAKVTRDRMMYALHEKYPEYGFDKHKGYGTAEHIDAILTHGMSDVHRRSFCTKLRRREASGTNMRSRGDSAEELAVGYVTSLGYSILERNYSCKCGEIDIIALDKGTTVFIEVKGSKNERFGTAQSHVTSSKIKKLRKSIEYYMLVNNITGKIRCDVAAINNGEVTYIKNAF